MSGRCRLVKTFEKSNLTTNCLSVIDWMYMRAAWIAASHPPGVPHRAADISKELAHVDTSWRSVISTVLGRMPPDFLESAMNRPPKNSDEMVTGQLSVKTILTKPVNAVRKQEPDSLHWTRSFKCCGRMPSGPSVQPAGNDSTAFLTSFSYTDRGVHCTPAKLKKWWMLCPKTKS